MKLSRLLSALLLTAAPMAAASAASAALPRFPQPFGDRIVFVADGNVWSVGKTGGEAVRLTSASGQDMFPRASPDGRWIAYTEASRAGTDVWVIPAAGGPARRLTYHPTTEAGTGGRHGPDNMVVTWTPDSKNVVYLSKGDQWNSWIQYMYKVPVMGGAPVAMPIDSAVGLATFGPDGHTIAYNRIFRNFRTWKRYNGGLAQQVFTYDFDSRKLEQITNWSGTNTSPMWYGKQDLLPLGPGRAPAGEHLGLRPGYEADPRSHPLHRLRHRLPGPGATAGSPSSRAASCIFLDLPASRRSEVPISVPDDNPRTRARVVEVKDAIRDQRSGAAGGLRPGAQRQAHAVLGARRHLQRAHRIGRDARPDRHARDRRGPSGLVSRRQDHRLHHRRRRRPADRRPPGRGGDRKGADLVREGYFYGPTFSPDGRTLAFSDGSSTGCGWSGVDGGAPVQVAQDKFGEIHDQSVFAGRPLARLQPGAPRRGGATSISTRSPPAGRRGWATAAASTPTRCGRRTASTSISPPTGTRTRCPRTSSSTSRS